MTDITALAQRMRAAAEKAKHAGEAPVMNFCSRIDALNEFQLAACPANVLALVEALEKAQKSNDFLKGQLSELANFNPDWDKLEASYESWREIAAELLVAKNRIVELESRTVTVKLPEPFKMAKASSGLTYYYADEIDKALATVGINVEVE